MVVSTCFCVNLLDTILSMRFQIRRSINNVYQARSLEDGRDYVCRIKGKVMKKEETEYSPVAVGDIAVGEPYSESEALLTGIEDRRSAFTRWNIKRQLNQTIAANQDQTLIVTACSSPPFRPRFLDRAMACSRGAELLIVMNKADEGLTEEAERFLSLYESLGISTLSASSKTGEGLDELLSQLKGKVTAFVGQSGVGKSTLINTLLGTKQRTGEISRKYNRGKHTTNHSLYIESEGFAVIDTPGVREIEVPFEDLGLVKESFPELRKLECRYDSCLHRGEEGCLAPGLVEEGVIDPDRYESYLRILDALESRTPWYMRKGKGNA